MLPSTVLSSPPVSDRPAMSAATARPMRSTLQLLIDRMSPVLCHVIDSWSTAAVSPKTDSWPLKSSEISVTRPAASTVLSPIRST